MADCRVLVLGGSSGIGLAFARLAAREDGIDLHVTVPSPETVVEVRSTLGANVGTTITALLASLAASSPESLTVALAHTTFNVFGILSLYVVPLARNVPVMAAERLADIAVERRTLAVVYVAVVFVVLPLLGVAALG